MGLIGAGHWQIDEYHTISEYRKYGIDYLWMRVIGWSPRPFSETLIYFYSALVNKTHLPHTAWILALLWLGLIFSTSLPFFRYRNSSTPRVVRLLITLLPLYLTLATAKTAEVFYWPFGAAAYIPTVATITIIFGILQWGSGKCSSTLWIICSTLLAASSEIGAFLIFFLTIFLLCSQRFTSDECRAKDMAASFKRALAPAFIMAILVIFDLTLGRVGNSGEAQMNPSASHDIKKSIYSSIPDGIAQIFTSVSDQPAALLSMMAIKICLILSAYSITKIFHLRSSVRSFNLIALGAACIATIFLTLFAAYYQFGISCCERHETLRQFLSFMAFMSFGSAFALIPKNTTFQKENNLLAIGNILLIIAIASTVNIKKLKTDYNSYADAIELNEINWIYTQRPPYSFQINSPKMKIVGEIFGVAEGVYKKNSTPSLYNQSIIEFFNVDQIDFLKRYPAKRLQVRQEIRAPDHSSSLQNPMACAVDRLYFYSEPHSSLAKYPEKLHISGWLNIPDAGLVLPITQVTLVTITKSQTRAIWDIPLIDRPDVVSHFGRQDLLKSGFNVSLQIVATDLEEAFLMATDKNKTAICQLHIPERKVSEP